jgi:subtilisin family serine protease
MNWNDAHCALRLLGIEQRAYPRFTVLDTGCNSITTGDEMTNIQQFNFVGGLNGVPESNVDSGIHGTAVAGIASVRTHNSTLLAGVASHNLPTRVTSCRCSSDGSSVQTIDVLRAMTWCIDNQSLRGGPGIINISLNSIGLPSYNASPVFQEIAKLARKKGDLFVNAAGNDGLVDPSPERNIRRVMAYDEDNNVASFSNTGPFKAGAPGVLVAAMDSPNSVAFGSGTSFAAPNWGGVAAFIMSLNPRLTAPKADKIVYKTADTTAQGNKIPNVNRAVISSILWGW